jgi:diadenosine tetraphosphatase ApaH/serine/threonine PP2A family protein phosphatase
VRYLIVSDIHSNWQALQAVLNHAEGRWDQALCCGDLVGYGADPNPVTDWVRGHCAHTVRGNHDKISLDAEDLEWFNPVARAAAEWTRGALTPENAAFLAALPHGPAMIEDFEIVHGSPLDEDEYLVAASEAGEAFAYLERRLAFFGHTHLQGGFVWNRARVETIPSFIASQSTAPVELDSECAYLINPGSVGQPRDGDPRAAYAIYDSTGKLLTYLRTEYDIEGAQRRIMEAGLPPVLADRLSVGR